MNKKHDADPSRGSDKTAPLTADLGSRIAQARAKREARLNPNGPSASRDMSGLSRGLRLGSEFVAATIVGAGIGYLLDLWLGTVPWFSLIMMLAGFAAGVINVIRAAEKMNQAAATPPPTAPQAPDDSKDA